MAIAILLFHIHWVFSSWRLPIFFGGMSLILGVVGFVLLWGVMQVIFHFQHRGPIDNPIDWIDINDPAHPIIGWYLLVSAAIFVVLATVTGHWRW